MYTFFWQKKHKYYSIELNKDLFGNFTLLYKWGSTRRSNTKFQINSYNDIIEAKKSLTKALKRRANRGYILRNAYSNRLSLN